MYAGAALLLAVSLLGLARATREVARVPVELRGAIPAVVYEPGPQRFFGAPEARERKLPVVLLAHGFSANKGAMSFLARHLARAGYAVVTFDFRGHGHNGRPLGAGFGDSSGLREDLDAALLYASTQPHLDPERIAVAGHSMGGFAVLDYASHNPGVNAVVAISAGAVPTGPYTPANVLLLFASLDPEGLRRGAREAGAHFADRERLVQERTYGDPERGTAVRVSELAGNDHLTILYSAEAGRRIADWLRVTLGRGETPAGGADGRGLWSALALVAYLVLFAGVLELLAPVIPRVSLPAVERPVEALGYLVASLAGAVLLLAGVDALATAGPFGFLPLVAGRELAGFYFVSGSLLALLSTRRGGLRSEGLLSSGTWVAAAGLLALSYVVFGTLAQPFVDLWIAPHRVPSVVAAALLSLPLFASSEWLLRGEARSGVWAPALGKLAIVVAIVVGTLLGLLPFVLLLGIIAFVLIFAVFELLCWRMSRTAPSPWLAALFQAGWTGWIIGAIFPYQV